MEHFWPGSPIIFLLAWFGWRIASKAGYSGFWGLSALIPPIGLIALWYLAMTKDWPSRGSGTSARPPKTDQPSSITIRRPTAPIERQ